MNMTFERTLLTEEVIAILRGVNDEISYDGLAKRANTTVVRVKTVLASARRILANEKIEFGVIFGQGLRRLAELDKARELPARQKRIGRAAGRLEKKAARIDIEKLPPAEATMVTTTRTIASLIRRHAFAKPDEPAPNPIEPPSTDTTNLVRLGKA